LAPFRPVVTRLLHQAALSGDVVLRASQVLASGRFDVEAHVGRLQVAEAMASAESDGRTAAAGTQLRLKPE
jgi:hypothetical protein